MGLLPPVRKGGSSGFLVWGGDCARRGKPN